MIDVELVALVEVVDRLILVTFEWTRVGKVELSRSTGECFRPVFARLVLPDPENGSETCGPVR